jgi:hypothetical protein
MDIAPPTSTQSVDRALCNLTHPLQREQAVIAERLINGCVSPGSLPLLALAVRRLVCDRRGGYRDPESQAFIESWFGKLKEREVWLNEYETLDDARQGIGGYVERYHHRPHSGLNYRTPDEVARTWEDQQELQKQAA